MFRMRVPRSPQNVQDFAEDVQIGLEGVELLDDNDLGFQVKMSTAFSRLERNSNVFRRPLS